MNDETEPDLLALRFGPFEIDVRSGELRRNGTTVRLQPQPFKVLIALAGRPGEVVTREEIQAAVWPAGTFVDFEQSLNFCIRQIRSALGDNANTPRYLETLPRRGYRWIGGPVERVTAGPARREWPRPVGAVPAPPDRASEPAGTVARARRPRALARWVAASGLALAGIAAVAGRGRLAPNPPAPAEPRSSQRVTFQRGAVDVARFAPGEQIVYTGSWNGGPPVVQVTQPDARDFRTLEIRGSVVGVSTTGEAAFLHGGVLARAPLAGGPPKEVLKPVVAADWTAAGTDFAVARPVEGGYRIEFPIGRVLLETAERPGLVRISPDGRHLAVTLHRTPGDDRGLVALLDREGRRVAATPEWASLDGLAWGPSGAEVWFTAAESGADNSLRALDLGGRVRQVLAGMGRLVLHDVAADGRALLERTTLRSEILFRRAGDTEDRDLSWLDFSGVEGISGDGGTILFFESGQGGGPGYSTFLRRTDGALPVRIGSGRALGLSPDGQWLLSVAITQPDHLDLTPTGPGENRVLRIAGLVAYETAGFVGDGRRVFMTGRDREGRRSTWLADLDGGEPRRLPLPEGWYLAQNTFTADGSRFVTSCPDTPRPCLYDIVAGNPVPVPGVEKGWRALGFDARGRLYLRDRSMELPERLIRLDPATGDASVVAELAPRDRAGVIGILRVCVAASGEAWTYSAMRRLSELHVVSGLE